MKSVKQGENLECYEDNLDDDDDTRSVIVPTVECEDVTDKRCVNLPSVEEVEVEAQACVPVVAKPKCDKVSCNSVLTNFPGFVISG